ncbi:MAG: polysaccharide biosynthesis C-terminal domain-containing protein [Bacteroidetes bacterium]|nr:polysaccharide biosynthesis C-terminal domain-containing protein [Bacteroidota bacterium]
MGIVFRQSVKTTIVNFTGAALGALIVFLSVNIISQQGYGFIKNITLSGGLINFFVLLGTSQLASTFTQRYEGNDERKRVLVTICAAVPVITTLVLTIPYFIFRQQIVNLYQPGDRPLVNEYYAWLPVLVLLWSVMTFFDQYLVSQLKIAISAFTREVVLRLFNVLFIVLFYLGWISFHALVVGSILIYAIPPVILLFVAMRTEGFGISVRWKVFTKREYGEMVHYAWYHLLFGASLNVMGFVDSLMLAPLDKSGMGALAVYSAAIYIATLMLLPYRAMISASYPVLNKAYIRNDEATLKDLFHRSGINILIVAIIMSILIGCNLGAAVTILPPAYNAIGGLVPVLMIGRVIDMATGLNSEVISISRHYKFNFYIAIVLVLIAISLNRLLIPQYGYYGAAWSATLSLVIFNIGKMIYLYRKMRLSPFTGKTWRVLVAGAVAALAGYYMPHFYQTADIAMIFIDVVVRSALILFLYVLLLVSLKPSTDLNNYIKAIRSEKKLF